MKIVKWLLLVCVLGSLLPACGDSDTGPFGNTPGPKKPEQF
jgi:hypothetical protein